MRLVRHVDAAAFRQRTLPFLLQAEVEHNVILGITDRMMRLGTDMFDSVFLAHVEDDNDTIQGAMMRTAPHGAMLSKIKNAAAIPLLCNALAEQYDALPTVQGEAAHAQQFAQLWQQRSRQAFNTKMDQGIYMLTKVTHPQNVSGECRRATRNEFDLLVDWRVAFTEGVALGVHTREQVAHWIETAMDAEPTLSIYLWWDDGKPVSMAAGTRHTPNGTNVSMVYTPPEFRGKGYASANTAALSQILLDHGRKFCCLYTDMSNSTSNKIYQAIGYQFLGTQRLIEFESIG